MHVILNARPSNEASASFAKLEADYRSAKGSHFPGVPFHYAALAQLGAGLIPDSVKVFTQAGGALDPRIQARIHDWASERDGRFFVMYGQTEASPRMTTLQHSDFSRKAGSVGVALAGGRLSIVDEMGAPLPAEPNRRAVC